MKATACEDCDHVHPMTREKDIYQWMCLKFPRISGLDPVAPTRRVVKEPYNRCQSINVGHCPLWTERKLGPLEQIAKSLAEKAAQERRAYGEQE